jgi:hypothetical protein
MTAGRHKVADAGALYCFAHVFYWELKTLAEGAFRVFVDKPKLERLKHATPLGDEDIALLNQQVSYEIDMGTLSEGNRAQRLRTLVDEWQCHNEFATHNAAVALSSRRVKIPGDPEIIAELFNATTPEQIVELCKDAFAAWPVEIEPGVITEVRKPNWPISGSSTLPMYLSQHAAAFIEAKNDPRFPRSARPSTQLKQFWFVSRALAGAIFGVSTRTAINLVGSLRPDEMFHELRDGRPARKQRKPKQIATRRH